MVKVKDEFTVFIDSNCSFQNRFIWCLALLSEIPSVEFLHVFQIVFEYTTLLGPEIIPQVALVLSVKVVIHFCRSDSRVICENLLGELLALFNQGMIVINESLIFSSSFQSILQGDFVVVFRHGQFRILLLRVCQLHRHSSTRIPV